jgi:hypothetical protein
MRIAHIAIFVLAPAADGTAQLNTVFNGIWLDILKTGLSTAPADHGSHYLSANAEANLLSPALNALIAGTISSFPLSSTSGGVTFDFSSGTVQVTTENSRPVFAETAKTLGRFKLNIGLNYNYLTLSRFRGVLLEDIRFTFPHDDIGLIGVFGDNADENDIVDILPNMNLNASIFTTYATLGLSNSIDIGVALPYVSVSLRGTAKATINSYTFANLDSATHYFVGDNEINPVLSREYDFDESASGIGDVAIRLKVSLAKKREVDVAGLLDIRLPTGDKKNFLGTGDANIHAMVILSKKISTGFTPHLNIGYERRGAKLDSDEFEFAAGFDRQLWEGLTFVVDFLGEMDINGDEGIVLLPDNENVFVFANSSKGGRVTREIDRSNIPGSRRDNIYNAALALKYASSGNLVLVGNLLIPLNDAGLRSGIVPTIGFAFNF